MRVILLLALYDSIVVARLIWFSTIPVKVYFNVHNMADNMKRFFKTIMDGGRPTLERKKKMNTGSTLQQPHEIWKQIRQKEKLMHYKKSKPQLTNYDPWKKPNKEKINPTSSTIKSQAQETDTTHQEETKTQIHKKNNQANHIHTERRKIYNHESVSLHRRAKRNSTTWNTGSSRLRSGDNQSVRNGVVLVQKEAFRIPQHSMDDRDKQAEAHANGQAVERPRDPEGHDGDQDDAQNHGPIADVVAPNQERIFPEKVEDQPEEVDEADE
ncbi:ABC-transporter ATP-binding protein [Striga asiatica]|uniref:ABC-transporter ATP-binding protein n=1 Tax=Striga asiatica TaxID=4170 RepID=A0A5A7R5P6_STRAF|nr:ABC-transporter ATP-binding protein [Striga asiatica]